MKHNTFVRVVVVVLLVITSCKEEKLVSTPETVVPVGVDLQSGFDDRELKVYFNQQLSFDADLSSRVPLAGPIAGFSTYLSRDSNRVLVKWRSHTTNSTYQQDSSTFFLGNADNYYLGLELRNDTLGIKIQDTPFLYL